MVRVKGWVHKAEGSTFVCALVCTRIQLVEQHGCQGPQDGFKIADEMR